MFPKQGCKTNAFKTYSKVKRVPTKGTRSLFRKGKTRTRPHKKRQNKGY